MRRSSWIKGKKAKKPKTNEEILKEVEDNLIEDENKSQQIDFEHRMKWALEKKINE